MKRAALFLLFSASLLPRPVFAGLLTPTDLIVYKAAFKAAEKKDYKEALHIAARAKDKNPLHYLKWRAYQDEKHTAESADIMAFLEENSFFPYHSRLTARVEKLLSTEKKKPKTILKWFDAHPPKTPVGVTLYANALLKEKRKDDATALLKNSWTTAMRFSKNEESAFVQKFGKHLTKDDHRARLNTLLWKRRITESRRLYRLAGSDWRALAEARILLMTRRGNVDRAVSRVPDTLKDHPGLIYERTRWRRRSKLTDKAIELLDHPAADTDAPERFWVERHILARNALEDGHVSQAYRLVSGHKMTPGGVAYAEAEFLSGWIALRFLAEEDRALGHFTKLYQAVTSPVSRSRGAYWCGRSVEKSTGMKAARPWYRNAATYSTSFYGQLAALRLNPDQDWFLPPDPTASPYMVTAIQSHRLTQIIRALIELEETDHVRRLASALFKLTQSPAQVSAFIEVMSSYVGRTDLAVFYARKARMKGVEHVRLGYPLYPLPTEMDIEPALALSMIRQESGFDTSAASHAGARGLMQLMPYTAKRVAKQLNMPYSKKRLSEDPAYNIRLGTAYINDLLEKYNGNILMGLAAYNAGPRKVKQWRKAFGTPGDEDTSALDWIESIPYGETRNYVQRIVENMQIYRRILDGHARLSPLQSFTGVQQ